MDFNPQQYNNNPLEIVTLNNVIGIFGNFAAQHKQIDFYAYGPLHNIELGTTTYPLLYIVPQPSKVNRNTINLVLDIYMLDLVKKDASNRNDTHSDTFQVLLDLKAFIRKNLYWASVDIVESSPIEPLWEKFDDETDGWKMQISLQIDWTADVCTIPGIYPSGATFTSGVGSYNVSLGSYLPLAGGVLTGGLTGTTGTFHTLSATTYLNLPPLGLTGDTYWLSGSTWNGTNFPIIQINDTGLDATGAYATAIGNGTLASGDASFAEGNSTTASGEDSHAEGNNTAATNFFAHAEGQGTTASGVASHTEGQTNIATNNQSHAEGFTTTSTGQASHSEGLQTTASNAGSHAEGRQTISSGQSAHAEGRLTIAGGNQAHAEGNTTTANGFAAHAEGRLTTASGLQSHAEGIGTTASSDQSHSEGASTIASNTQSHAEGNKTTSSGAQSHSEGYNTTASGDGSHAEGQHTIASLDGTHAEGADTTASGLYSHAQNSGTIASGNWSHAGGNASKALGVSSFVHGENSAAVGQATVVLGSNLTGNTANTVYVPFLNINSIPIGTVVNNLGYDINGNIIVGTTSSGSFSGGTVTGATNFTGGLTANTISATTYLNLPIDIRVTGGTPDNTNHLYTFINNTGGTFNVIGLNDITITGGTFNRSTGIETFTNNTGGTFSVSGLVSTGDLSAYYPITGGTVLGSVVITGNVTVLGTASTFNTQVIQAEDNNIHLNYSGTHLTANGGGFVVLSGVSNSEDSSILIDANGNWSATTSMTSPRISATTISATTYLNLPSTFDTAVTAFTYNNNTFNISQNSGNTLSATINSVTGLTVNGILSATTYQGLPIDVRVTGGTYTAGTATFTNNTGGTFSVTGFNTGSTNTFTTGFTYNNNTFTITDNSNTSYNASINTVTGLTVNGSLTVTALTANQIAFGSSANTLTGSSFYQLQTFDSANGGRGLYINSGVANNFILGNYVTGAATILNSPTAIGNITFRFQNGANAFSILNDGSVFSGFSNTRSFRIGNSTSAFSILELAGGLSGNISGTTGLQLGLDSGTYNNNTVSTAITTSVVSAFNRPTLATTAVTALTITNAATVYIDNSPSAGTNTTIVNAMSLWVASGTTRLDGGLTANTITATTISAVTISGTSFVTNIVDTDMVYSSAGVLTGNGNNVWNNGTATQTITGSLTCNPSTIGLPGVVVGNQNTTNTYGNNTNTNGIMAYNYAAGYNSSVFYGLQTRNTSTGVLSAGNGAGIIFGLTAGGGSFLNTKLSSYVTTSATGGTLSNINSAYGFQTAISGTVAERFTMYADKFGVGVTVPGAFVDVIGATSGLTTATTASLRIRSGTTVTTPNQGDIWNNGTNLLWGAVSGSSKSIVQTNGTILTSTQIPYTTTGGDLITDGTLNWTGTNTLQLGTSGNVTFRNSGGAGFLFTSSAAGTALAPTNGSNVYITDQSNGNPTVWQIYCNTVSGVTSTLGFGLGNNVQGKSRLDITGSTSTISSIRVRSGSTVTSPLQGDIWNDNTYLNINGLGLNVTGGTSKFSTVSATTYQNLPSSVSNYSHTIFTPTVGGTVQLIVNQYNIINPAGPLLTLTVNLPSTPNNSDVVYIKFTQNISTVTYANGTIVDGITAPTAGGLTVLVYDSGTTSWY